MTFDNEQLERLFTKLGAMHSDIKSLERQSNEAHDELDTLRGDLDELKRTVSRAVGWGAGAGGTLALGISLWASLT